MSTILVGVDDEPSARDAVVLARTLAGEPGAERLLLAAVEVEPLVPLPEALRPSGPSREELERTVAGVCADCAPHARTMTVAERSPARALRTLAEREPAGLVVLGSSRRAQPGQAFAGRTVRQVMHDAPSAVALAARGLHERDYALRRIVVGVDGSPEGREALERARALAAAHGAALHLVAVADEALPVSRAPLGEVIQLAEWDEALERRRVYANRVLDEAAAAVGELGADAVTGEVRVGDPPEQLAAAAADADLLVVGSRHWGPLSRVVVGSTAEELLRGAPCSLLLVPRPDSEPDAG